MSITFLYVIIALLFCENFVIKYFIRLRIYVLLLCSGGVIPYGHSRWIAWGSGVQLLRRNVLLLRAEGWQQQLFMP